MRWSWRNEALGLAAALILLACLPAVVTDSYSRHVLIMVFIYGIVAASWDLSLGYAGIFNFGHLALFGVGLYAYGILTKELGVDPWLSLAGGGLAATLAAILVSVPILRLKGIYIILVTFGFAQLIMQIVINQSNITGGMQGMVRIPTVTLWDHNLLRDGKLAYYYIALVILVLAVVFLRGFARSHLGKSVVALRDNEEYAISRGVSLARQRVLTLAASAFFTGVAGAYYGAYLRTASVDVFSMSTATLVLSMVLLGGTGTIYGSLLASLLLTIFSERMADYGAWRPIMTAVLIIVVMLLYPGGLAAALQAGLQRLGRLTRRRA